MASLRFTSGVLKGTSVPLRADGTRIGRDPGLDLVVPFEDQQYVSRRHALIRRDDGGFVVEDLQSSNGTLVNGRPVRRAVLAHGDEIQFGRMGPVARFEAPDDAPTIAPGARPAIDAAAPAPAPPAERPSMLIRRLVDEKLSSRARHDRQRLATLAAAVVLIAASGAWAMHWLSPEQVFRRMADDLKDRVVYVEVGLKVGAGYRSLGSGSGFFAGHDGFVVTNKHVARPEMYDPDVACDLAVLRRANVSHQMVITVWKGGSQFRQTSTSRTGDRGLGYSTEQGTLALVASAADNVRTIEVPCDTQFGRFRMEWNAHVTDNNDLSVLRVMTADPVPGFELGDADPEPDDPVMVFGFPRGVSPQETTHVEPIRRTGRVLRTQDTVQIDAVVLHGNSGGPLLDTRGRVVGITTRGPAESLNMAIKAEYARRVLDRARQVTAR